MAALRAVVLQRQRETQGSWPDALDDGFLRYGIFPLFAAVLLQRDQLPVGDCFVYCFPNSCDYSQAWIDFRESNPRG
jgi:hypothetical protein